MKKLLLLALLSIAVPSVSYGATINCVSGPVLLSTLIASDGCQVGDKLFSSFGDVTNPLGSSPSASQISVQGITTADGNFGLEFTGAFLATAGQTMDFLLSYVVTVLDPTRLLSDIHLVFNGNATGTGFAEVIETVRTGVGGAVLGQAQVTTFNPPTSLESTVFLSQAVRSAYVQKDIIISGGANGTASISWIDQVTSQTPVPEPASLTLLGTGLFGLVRAMKRRKTAATI